MTSVTPMPRLGAAEYDGRINALKLALAERGIACALVHAPTNIVYFCGFETVSTGTYACLIVPAAGAPTLVVWELERAVAEATATADSIITYPTGADPLNTVLSTAGIGSGRIAVEWELPGLTPRMYATLAERLGGPPDDVGILITGIRRIKSQAELDRFRAAATHTDRAMIAAIRAATVGASDNTMAAAALQAMTAGGSEYSSMPPIISAGRQSGFAHATFRNIALTPGDAVVIELGGCVQRYCTPLMRTVTIGTPRSEVAELYFLAEAVLARGLEALAPGRSASDVAEEAWAVLGDLGDIVFHGVFAYAVGPGFPPSWADGTLRVRRGATELIEAGMVLHLPIALRRPGICGVAVSETVVVSPTGVEILGRVPRELAVR